MLRKIPIVVLTASSSQRDAFDAYEANANGYFIKPVDLAVFHAINFKLEDFWAQTVSLPNAS